MTPITQNSSENQNSPHPPHSSNTQINEPISKAIPSQKTIDIEGVLVFSKQKSGQLLDPNRHGKTSPKDPYLSNEFINRFKLKEGSYIKGKAFSDNRFPNPRTCYIESVDGQKPEERKKCYSFSQLTSTTPDSQLKIELSDGRMTTRVVDLFCPIGKGQRGLIVAPPRTGKTTLLQDIAKGIIQNHPECYLIVVLVDERPEEVTDFKRSVNAEIYASSNDETPQNHIRIAELAIQRAKRLTEVGKDTVLLLDSITRLARAYNISQNSGKTMSGGLDIRALEKPRQLFSSARNSQEGGSLTIIASALIETGSKMDDLIFQEFKGTGNMEMVLDRKLAELRLWPAINLSASGTRKEELLLSPSILSKVQFYRRAISNLKMDDATESTLQRLSTTKTNADFLKLITTQ